MNKILIFTILCLSSQLATAQKEASKKVSLSPEASFTQAFGESSLTLSYARPSARGRKIFGALVPFDTLWRTGASDCTTVSFKTPLIVGGKTLAGGKYALFTIPGKDEWTVVLNTATDLHGTFGYDAQKDVHRFKVKPQSSSRFYETFTLEISDCTPKGAAFLNIIWENTLVQIPLELP